MSYEKFSKMMFTKTTQQCTLWCENFWKIAGLGFGRLAWGGENRRKGDSGPPSRPHSTPAADAYAAAQQDSAAE